MKFTVLGNLDYSCPRIDKQRQLATSSQSSSTYMSLRESAAKGSGVFFHRGCWRCAVSAKTAKKDSRPPWSLPCD